MDQLLAVHTIYPERFDDPNRRENSPQESLQDLSESEQLTEKQARYTALKKNLSTLIDFAEANSKALSAKTIMPDEFSDEKLVRPFSLKRGEINQRESKEGNESQIVVATYKKKNEETGGWFSVTIMYSKGDLNQTHKFDGRLRIQFAQYDPNSGDYEQVYEKGNYHRNGLTPVHTPNYIRALPEDDGSNRYELLQRYSPCNVNVLDVDELGGFNTFFSVDEVLSNGISHTHNFERELEDLANIVVENSH